MRILTILTLIAAPAFAQTPGAELVNLSRVGSTDFEVGDRYEIVVTAWANEPVSVRTTRNSVTDWSGVLGWTDQSGQWKTQGRFEKADFGVWSQGWTVGGLLTRQPLTFFVTGACLPKHPGVMEQSGPNISMTCETADGPETYVAPPFGAAFRAPDGRMVPGLTRVGTPEQRMGILIEDSGGASGLSGDDAAALIAKVLDSNALSDREIRNVIQIIRIAFQNVDRSSPGSGNSASTLTLLKQLAEQTEQPAVKKEIAAAIASVPAL